MNSIKLYADQRGVYRAEPADDPTAPDDQAALLEVVTADLVNGGDGHLQALPEAGGWRMLVVVPPHTAAGDWQPLLTYALSMITQFFAIGPDAAGWSRYGDDMAPGGWYIRARTYHDLPDLSFLDEVTE
jgi:hypothetical protein